MHGLIQLSICYRGCVVYNTKLLYPQKYALRVKHYWVGTTDDYTTV